MFPTVVSISGFSSESGKTHIICELLRRAPGWEAIKVTRGHYRSCGKDPHACCVSGRLGNEPIVLSDPCETRVPGKDTGRYWEAGASNVHWVIGTDEQVALGVTVAIGRVQAPGVFVEGASFLKQVAADYSIMVANPSLNDVKSSAVGLLARMNALIVNSDGADTTAVEDLRDRVRRRGGSMGSTPVFFLRELCAIGEEIRRIHEERTAARPPSQICRGDL